MRENQLKPKVAIPVPHSGDREYAERALPQYENAVIGAGGEPVRIELDAPEAKVLAQAALCDAVLLPGSRADIDPAKYTDSRHEKTAASDAPRDAVDHILLKHAFEKQKPILGICYGLQSLNVYRLGTLVQHIESAVNHSAGRAVPLAHAVEVERGSRLARIMRGAGETADGKFAVNSSHHQSADRPGTGLRVVAHSPSDGVVEALEGTNPEHFVLAVQWHPERSVQDGPEVAESAKAIFRAFVQAARERRGV